MKKRVWVSGIGIVCPIGSNIKEFSEGLLQGREGFQPITDFEARKGKDKAALVSGYRPDDPGRAVKMLRRAVKEALDDAGLPGSIRKNTALVMATMAGDTRQAEQVWGGLKRDGNIGDREKANSIIKYPNSSLLDAVARTFKIQGLRTVVSNACASGNIAVGYGMSLLQAGRADAVIVCGLEVLKESMYWGMHGLRIMSSELKAFDANRKGTVLGEGAGVLVLETADSILNRKGRSWGEIAGYGNRSDPQSDSIIPNEDGAGLAAAMNQAIVSAGIEPENIDYLNAYGTGTKVSDLTETKAIKQLFGKNAPVPPVSSSKTFLGNSGAASGVLEAIVTLVAMREGFIPPTLHWDTRDKELDLDYVPAKGRQGRIVYALSNSIGGGGVNTSIVLKAIDKHTGLHTIGTDEPEKECTPDDIVITGVGIASDLGNDRDTFESNLKRFYEARISNMGSSCARDMTKFLDTQFQRANMAAKFLLAAAQGAVEESKLLCFNSDEVGVVVGTAFGGYTSTAGELCKTILNPGPNFITPYILTNNGANLGATLLSRSYGISGYNATLTTGSTAGIDAIIHAADILHNENRLKAVLVGGVDI
ncbi:MAG TPA: beta-ketoacyl-[acyl-carrier-protein] synthase family protein, partial [Ruminiclostridium sp.]|nr:beta-ketoacyl-[acyl-carrier-protein] synthase family protein [Ruminiclostridium sp.]